MESAAEFQMRIPIAFIGGLIGFSGYTIESIRKETGCEVRISPREKTDLRKVTLSGNVQLGLKKLFEHLVSQLEKAMARNKQEADWCERGALSNVKEGQEFKFKVEVGVNQIGAIIGKRGEHVESLRRTANCQVRVQQHGGIEVCGKLEHIYNVMSVIWERIKGCPSRVFMPETILPSRHSSGPDVEMTIMIPSDSIGMLIGKKGEQITQIRRHCAGVQIYISNEEDAAPLQCITNGNVKEFSLDKTMRTLKISGCMADTARCYEILATYIV